MKEGSGSSPQPSIFTGIRVVEFGHILAGPTCAKHMADMGAEVIKVERPVFGDAVRTMPAECFKNGVSGMFMWRNGGKKSFSLDMKHAEAVEIVKDLIRVSDVVVQNMKVGVMDRMGIGYDDLREINPRLIMCSISGYGQNGPLADWPALDVNIQAMSGAMAIGGHPDGPPLPSWVSWADSATAAHAFGAVSAALFHRERTGVGQHIDISMLDVAVTYHDFPIMEYLWTDGKVNQPRNGPMHPSLALLGVFKCRDGYLVVSSTNDAPWRRLIELIGQPELAADPRFIDGFQRNRHKDEVNRLLSDWIKDFDMRDARILLEENGVVSTPILSIDELINHPHMQARDMLAEVDDPRTGRVRVPNTPFKFSATEARVRGRAPLLGEHNDEVLVDVLGYSKERIARLWQDGVLYTEEGVAALTAS